jgi:heavy metal sensor kinase
MKLPRSIKWRLQLWHGLILVLVLGGFGWTALEFQQTRELRRVDEELRERMRFLIGPPPPAVRAQLRVRRHGGPGEPNEEPGDGPGGWQPPRHLSPPSKVDPMQLPRTEDGNSAEPGPPMLFPRRRWQIDPVERARLFDAASSPAGFYFVVWGKDGRVVESSDSAERIPQPRREPPRNARTRGSARELIQFTPRGETVLVGRSIARETADMRKLGLLLLVSGAGILAIGLIGGSFVATKALQPIESISNVALKIASGDLAQRIPNAENESELGRLVSILNSTFARLEAAFTEQVRFTTDVSHELRTPVAVVVSQTQTALARERSAAEYKGTIEACQRAAQRMRGLIESLLQLARLDAGQEKLNLADVDLAKVAEESVAMLQPLAAEKSITLSSETQSSPCRADSERIGQVITNLLTNAIQYTPSNGKVIVRTELAGGMALVSVIDNGPGIPAEDLPRIFHRFYRVEQSRSRDKGGSGLGLAISRGIVNAHGGTLDVSSTPGEGTTFTIRLPAGK